MSSGRLAFVPPMLPTLVEKPPKGTGWLHEVKFDGYRTQIIIDAFGVRAFTRRGHDWTTRYRPIVEAADKLLANFAIIDGEMILPTADGTSDFHAFRKAIAASPGSLAFVAFDLLYLDGRDLRELPLVERKARLAKVISGADTAIQYSDHFETEGAAFYERVEAMGLEGMVSKRPDSPYVSGRTERWLKTKAYEVGDFEVAGLLRERGKPFVAYMVDKHGTYAGGAFVNLPKIRERLLARVTGDAPSPRPKGMKMKPAGQWVAPGLKARVRFLKGEEELRHATVTELHDGAPDRSSSRLG